MRDLKAIINNMTIREKIGQLTQYNANIFVDTNAKVTGVVSDFDIKYEDLKTVGNVLNFCSPVEMRKVQKEHLENDRNKIPMMFMMDVIHGFRTIYPIPLALGSSFSRDVVTECTKMAAREACAGGVNVTYAPMIDYVRDGRWGRVMETCGEDAYLNSVMGATQVKAYQGDDLKDKDTIAACVKHFAAYGGAEAGRDYNTVELSEHVLREHYLPAYKACVDAGVAMLMTSFNTLNGVPMTANPWLMNKVLREEWGFNGVVISDYSSIVEAIDHGVAKDKKDAARYALQTKCDIEMCSTAYFNHAEELIEEGIISIEEIDEAVFRVLELKEKLGLFDDPYRGASETEECEEFLSERNRNIARCAAEECAVLLKNEGVLPFSKDVKKIALIGPFADNHKIIGFWACDGKNDDSVTVYEGVKNLLPDAEIKVVKGCSDEWDDYDTSGFAEAVDAAKDADVVVLCLGEPQDYSGEGNSKTDISIHKVQLELAKAVMEVNKNTAVVTFSGRPLVLTEIEPLVPAILHMWFPGTEGGSACANLLFGEANPSGKLSMCFPEATGQYPLYYNHTRVLREGVKGAHHWCTQSYIDCNNLPLYSFGHGLSYSNFIYEDLTLSKTEMTKDDEIEVSITVKNNSNVGGKEVVMLYMQDVIGTTARPVQQLIAFDKVNFEPNEKKVIKFTINEEMLRFWNYNNEFVSEPGEFKISTGYADHLLLTKEFYLK